VSVPMQDWQSLLGVQELWQESAAFVTQSA
jgi:hypothetical protein